MLARLRKPQFRDDLLASISVALIALPLGLGIALASGAPPLSGLIAAIVGGLLTTFIRSSHVAINGPSAGLITVVLAGVESMGFEHVLGAIVVAGAIQMVLGFFKLGELGEFFPASVLHGMLAAIGMIIFAKQIHVALGTDTVTYSGLDAFLKVPQSVMELNPFVTLISVVGLLMMILHPKAKNRIIKAIPSALWVLLVAIPLVFAFNLFQSHDINVMDRAYHVGPEYLIDIPDDIRSSLLFPKFSMIGTLGFWLTVLAIVLVSSVETLVSTKAVDKLDPLKRKTDLNRDLMAVGLSTVASGMIGGLPIITVIVRSSVNVNHGAKTKWSNFFHGLILLILVLVFPWVIREIPKAALAAILIYTGYKLASPKVFRDIARHGWEQLLIFVGTLIACLAIDLLWGILFGVVFTLFIQMLRSGLQPSTFLTHAIRPDIKVINNDANGLATVEVHGIANFFIIRKLLNVLHSVEGKERVDVDMSTARLVDHTVLDLLHDQQTRTPDGSTMTVSGLEHHISTSTHPHAMQVLSKPILRRLTRRQTEIMHYAGRSGHSFDPHEQWECKELEKYECFGHSIVEFRRNIMKGVIDGTQIPFEVFDVMHTEGVLMADEEHEFTVALIRMPNLPEFTLHREEVVNWKNGGRKKDLGITQLRGGIGRLLFGDRSAQDALRGLKSQLLPLLMNNAPHYISSNGIGVLIHANERTAGVEDVMRLEKFCGDLVKALDQ